jgi:NitT/TauT family transport system permease protein
MRKRLTNLVITLMPFLVVCCLWELSVRRNPIRQFLFGSPSAIIQVATTDLCSSPLWTDVAITALEAFLGLAIGTLLGTLSGILLWLFPSLSRILRPYLVIIGAVPIFAIAPMLTIWFGTGLTAKVVMAAFATFFVSLAHALEGATHASNRYSSYACSLGTTSFVLIRKIILPGASHWVLAGIKINIGLALVGSFIGEFVSSEAGLGHYILKAGSLYDTPRVLLGVGLCSCLALLANMLSQTLTITRSASKI